MTSAASRLTDLLRSSPNRSGLERTTLRSGGFGCGAAVSSSIGVEYSSSENALLEVAELLMANPYNAPVLLHFSPGMYSSNCIILMNPNGCLLLP